MFNVTIFKLLAFVLYVDNFLFGGKDNTFKKKLKINKFNFII